VFLSQGEPQRNAVKFFDVNASADARKINAVDMGILELRTAIQNMHLQLDGIQNKIDELSFISILALDISMLYAYLIDPQKRQPQHSGRRGNLLP
jgi:hypothetical protein